MMVVVCWQLLQYIIMGKGGRGSGGRLLGVVVCLISKEG